MSEFAGVILQNPAFEGKKKGQERDLRFKPFGASLNSAMVPHGMDKNTHENARTAELKPTKVGAEGFMIFLFESEAMMGVTEFGVRSAGASTAPISALLREKGKL